MGCLRQSREETPVAVERIGTMVMDKDTERELNLMWTQGIAPMREQMSKWQTELKEEMKDLKKTLTEGKRLVVTLIVTAVPTWIAAFVAWLSLRK